MSTHNIGFCEQMSKIISYYHQIRTFSLDLVFHMYIHVYIYIYIYIYISVIHGFTDEQIRCVSDNMSLVVRKLVFGVSDQVRHKPGCATTEDG